MATLLLSISSPAHDIRDIEFLGHRDGEGSHPEMVGAFSPAFVYGGGTDQGVLRRPLLRPAAWDRDAEPSVAVHADQDALALRPVRASTEPSFSQRPGLNTYPADEQQISEVERGHRCEAVVPLASGQTLVAGDEVLFALCLSRGGSRRPWSRAAIGPGFADRGDGPQRHRSDQRPRAGAGLLETARPAHPVPPVHRAGLKAPSLARTRLTAP